MDTTLLMRRRGVAAWVTVSELSTWILEGRTFALVDIRTTGEFQSGHVPGAANVPDDAPHKFTKWIARDELTVLVCRNGDMSHHVARMLDYCDYTRVVFLHGGLSAWRAAGHPVARAAAVRLRKPEATHTTRIALDDGMKTIEMIRRGASAINARVIGAAVLGVAAIAVLTLIAFAR